MECDGRGKLRYYEAYPDDAFNPDGTLHDVIVPCEGCRACKPCPECGSSGIISPEPHRAFGFLVVCKSCNGTGIDGGK